MALCAIITLSRYWRPPKFLPHLQISRFPQYCRITMSSASQIKLTAPYGSWKSPITADVVSGSDKRLGGFDIDSFGRLYWLESRPAESGFVSFRNYCFYAICMVFMIKIVCIWERKKCFSDFFKFKFVEQEWICVTFGFLESVNLDKLTEIVKNSEFDFYELRYAELQMRTSRGVLWLWNDTHTHTLIHAWTSRGVSRLWKCIYEEMVSWARF